MLWLGVGSRSFVDNKYEFRYGIYKLGGATIGVGFLMQLAHPFDSILE